MATTVRTFNGWEIRDDTADELEDVRTDYEGDSYSTAGASVRGADSKLATLIDEFSDQYDALLTTHVVSIEGEWDSSTAYAQFSVVTDSDGNSYTAKVDVPAGTALTNTDYWALTGDYNAQVEQYRQEVMQYAGNVEELSGVVGQWGDELAAEIEAREAADETINASGWVTTDRIADDTITIDKLKQNLLIFGDSWGAFSEGYENWVERANVDKILNANVFNYAIGGSTFGSSDKMISTQVNTAINAMNSVDKANTRWIVIVGGINDTHDMSTSTITTITSALNAMCTLLKANYPNARIVWAPSSCAYALSITRLRAAVRNAWQIKYNDAPYHDYSVVDNLPYFWVGHKSSEVFRSDNLHLNSNGAVAFGKAILAALQGNSAPYSAKETISGLVFIYNTLGQTIPHGIYTASTTGNTTLISELTPLTEFLQATYGIPESQLWFGMNGGATNVCWLRFAGNTSINMHVNAAETYYF